MKLDCQFNIQPPWAFLSADKKKIVTLPPKEWPSDDFSSTKFLLSKNSAQILRQKITQMSWRPDLLSMIKFH